MMNVQLLNSAAQIRAISPAWQTLLDKSNSHRVFSSPQWYLATIDVFEELIPWVWILQDGDHLRGIAPLVLQKDNDCLGFLSDLADYQDIIVAENDLQAASALLQDIIAAPHQLMLAGLRSESNVCRAFAAMEVDRCQLDFLPSSIYGEHICYFSDLSRGYGDYFQSLSGRFRANVRKTVARATAQQCEVCELTPQQISGGQVTEHFLRLHLLRFPDRLFSRPKPQAFCRRILPELFMQGLLRVFVVRKNDELIAIQLSMHDIHSLGIWNGGFDPLFAAIAPGKLLTHLQIELCGREGINRFDFLRGDEDYKKSWATGYQFMGVLSSLD